MQQLQLNIPSPCHENWDNMLPAEKGRFCNACAKQVVDFSVMSDAEVISYFSQLKEASVCGRAYPDQLNRVIATPEPVKKKKWYWNYIALFLMLFSRSGEARAQNHKVGKIAMPVKPPKQHCDTISEVGEIAIAVTKRAISGKVLNASGNPLPYATVSIAGTNRRYAAGKDGGFSFLVTGNDTKLIITAPGYISRTIALNTNTHYNIKLNGDVAQGDVRVTAGMMIVKPVRQ